MAGARAEADVVLVTPHWGPNRAAAPLPHVRAAAARLLEAGATLVAGHSAHVVQGVAPPVLFDLGDFLDDYAVEGALRNDLGVLWLATVAGGPRRLEALPVAIRGLRTELAGEEERAWMERRLGAACAEFGTAVRREGGLLVVGERDPAPRHGVASA